MEELYRHFGSSCLSVEEYSQWSLFETTEIWQDRNSGRLWIQQESFSPQHLPAWRSGKSAKHYPSSEPLSRHVRLVVVGKDPKQSQKEKCLGCLPQIVDDFGLRLAYDYAMSCVTIVTELPHQSKTDCKVYTYTVVYHHKLIAIWSFTRPTASAKPMPTDSLPTQDCNYKPSHLTQGIILAGPQERAILKGLLRKQWDPTLSLHAMFPAFLCGLLMSQQVDQMQSYIKEALRRVEVRTGHHIFTGRQEQPAMGSLAYLSAQMSGFATKLASTTRKIQVTRELQSFMLAHSQEAAEFGSDADVDATVKIVEHHVEFMDKRLEMQLLDNGLANERVRIQLNAIFNLIAQKDSSIGLQTARASQVTALSNLHDSSSMKVLALGALLFLPGSFLATLFSAPFFNWDGTNSNSIGLGIKPQFTLYWAITIPLTGLTFILYALWLLLQRRRRQEILKSFSHDTDMHCESGYD